MRARLRLLALPLVVCAAAIATIAASSGASAAGTCPTSTSTSSTTSSSSSTTSAAVNCPTVTTSAPTGVTDTTATFHGTVNPQGTAATCDFKYGPTTAYGSRTTPVIVPNGTAPQQVATSVSGLSRNSTFHVALECSNAAGTVSGQDVTFSTTSGGPSTIRLSGHTGFVSPSGIAGVFIGCYGGRDCNGSLTLKRLSNGATVGHRDTYFIASQSGGIIHVPLSEGAMSVLRGQGYLNVTVDSTTTDGQTLLGGDAGRTLQLHIFR